MKISLVVLEEIAIMNCTNYGIEVLELRRIVETKFAIRMMVNSLRQVRLGKKYNINR